MNCSICLNVLPKGRKLKRCRSCNRLYMRTWYRKNISHATDQFPGVDIDRIHAIWRKG